MTRKVWNKENIINEVNSMGITFLYFIKFDKYKSKFMAQCQYGHKPYETNLNTLHKGRKAMGCTTCKSINKSQTNINKVDFNELKEYIEQHNHILLTAKKDYNGFDTKLKIQCVNCDITEEITFPAFRKRVKKCPNCVSIERYNIILNKCKEINFTLLNNKIDGTKMHVDILCDKGHKINPRYESFIIDGGCPYCNESKGEKKVESFLIKNNIEHIFQCKFNDCKFYKELPFDFYLPKYNILIEFDGKQHHQIIEYFGGLDRFIDQKIRDTIKNIYCQQNNIKLIRIPYWDLDNIENILKQELNL